MNIVCIADRESSLGFRLAGVRVREADSRVEAVEAFGSVLEEPDMGIVIVTDRVAAFIRGEIERLIHGQRMPLVLEIPSRGGGGTRRSVADLLKSALGISV